jgi:hypothetical protein
VDQQEFFMDIVAAAAFSSDMAQANVAADAQIAVLKKAMNIESSSALQLLQVAVQAAPQVSNPPNLGNSIDTFA